MSIINLRQLSHPHAAKYILRSGGEVEYRTKLKETHTSMYLTLAEYWWNLVIKLLMGDSSC